MRPDPNTVEIYTTPICPYCAMAKRLLDRKGVSYMEIDVSRDPQLGYFLAAGAVVDAWQGGDSTDVGAP